MIESKGLTKYFDDICAVNHVDVTIKEGTAFGLLGTNGAGKSTFLRIIAGILKQDLGTITVDGQDVFEAPAVKAKCFYISDDQYFFPNTTAKEVGAYYAAHYTDFDTAAFNRMLSACDLPLERKVNAFSKGMKKQLSLFAGLAARTPYLLCDETFDGLDPVMRQAVKSLMADAIASRSLTPVIASHNLRELEEICDHVGLLHKGGLLLARDLEEMRTSVHKLQVVFPRQLTEADLPELDIVSLKSRGRVQTLIIRGEAEDIERRIDKEQPVFCELLPLTLEELFITETEVAGYEFPQLGI